jgi:hypothetical protein
MNMVRHNDKTVEMNTFFFTEILQTVQQDTYPCLITQELLPGINRGREEPGVIQKGEHFSLLI